MKKRWKIPAILILILILLAGGSAIYVQRYYRADAAATAALAADGAVRIGRTDYGWLFDGPSEDAALIFYPGAKVEETAYAPLLRRLAGAGVDVCLVKMPARLAILGTGRAERVMRAHDYDRWYIGGHSLGGVCAARFASAHADSLEGLILLAAYPAEALDESLRVLMIRGSNDGVLRMDAYERGRQYAPNAEEHVIEGGNHAQFGSYGFQKGDGIAGISPEEQMEETAQAILAFTEK